MDPSLLMLAFQPRFDLLCESLSEACLQLGSRPFRRAFHPRRCASAARVPRSPMADLLRVGVANRPLELSAS
eukprot:2556992-Pyramimonas_sp.AAC.1